MVLRRHQMGRPKPRRQRQLGPVHDRPCRHRRLPSTGDTLIGVGSALQQPGPRPAAYGAGEPIRPAPLEQEECTDRFVRKPTLEFDQGSVSSGHAAASCGGNQLHVSETWDNGISLKRHMPMSPEFGDVQCLIGRVKIQWQ